MLEVGCGYGRVTKWIYDEFKPTRYDAIDLSPDQIIKARELVQQGVNFAVKTIQEFETTLSYDLVFAAEVLLHVMPSEIECVIAKLLRLGRHLVHIDPIKGDNLHPHNFIHNYAEIYTKLGKTVDMVEVKATGQHIIHVC
jgi:2-polyprenyl-3-methyl-5-hydroxy-6-metoxy-1,4-benzoquinol methylase